MKNNTKEKKIDIREGNITFWVKENTVQWNDNQITVLFNITVNTTGSLFMVKDNDNKLKFFHVFLNYGRTDVETVVSMLDPSKRHFIAATWSVYKKEICLYVDGELKDKKSIQYNFKE